MNLRVIPQLEKVIQAAQEASITITEVNFIRAQVEAQDDILSSLSIAIEGPQEALGYFSYLLEQEKLHALV